MSFTKHSLMIVIATLLSGCSHDHYEVEWCVQTDEGIVARVKAERATVEHSRDFWSGQTSYSPCIVFSSVVEHNHIAAELYRATGRVCAPTSQVLAVDRCGAEQRWEDIQ